MCKKQDIYWLCKVPDGYRSPICLSRKHGRKWRDWEYIPCKERCGQVKELLHIIFPIRASGRRLCPECKDFLDKGVAHCSYYEFRKRAVTTWDEVEEFVQQRTSADDGDEPAKIRPSDWNDEELISGFHLEGHTNAHQFSVGSTT